MKDLLSHCESYVGIYILIGYPTVSRLFGLVDSTSYAPMQRMVNKATHDIFIIDMDLNWMFRNEA